MTRPATWRLFALLPALWFCSCASHVLIPPEQQANLERDLTGQERDRFLKLSFFVTPFFGDASKRLLTAVPPEHVRSIDHPDGTPVNPGRVEKILPAGTRVRIRKLELPSAWVVSERVLYTPRTQPWVYLGAREELELPLILVLRPMLKTEEELRAEIDRYLAREDPTPRMQSWSEAVREAVRTKKAIPEMPADALEMAWGYPERKRMSYAGSVRNEEWIYAGGKRLAFLGDGRVTRLEGEGL